MGKQEPDNQMQKQGTDHNEIWMNHQQNPEKLWLGHCDINQVEMFILSHTKMLLEHNNIDHMSVFTSTHFSTCWNRD